MGLKGDYTVVDTQFSKESLHVGAIACRVTGFREKSISEGRPVIDLFLEIYWTSNEEDQVFIGQKTDWAVFFGGQWGHLNTDRLKKCAAASGFDLSGWTVDNGRPMSLMLPGFLKLLAVKGYLVLFNVVTTKPKTGPDGDKAATNVLNIVKVLRVDPGTSEPVSDRPPDAPLSDDLILDALDEEVAGEDKTTPF
jgi:hypothetical protein